MLRGRAAAWTIERAAREAGVDPVLLDRFVELYAATTPAVIRAGYGLERNRNGGSAVAAVIAIPAVAGKFGVRGGGFTMSNSDARWTVTGETAIGTEPQVARHVNMSGIAAALATLRDPPIECLFVYNCNPAATAPDQRALIAQLRREDLFTVVHDQVWTDTAQLADVVLPATSFLEHRELRRGYGHMRMYDSPAVATPAGEARSNNELFGALLERFGLVRAGDAMTDQELVDHTFAASAHGGELQRQLASHQVAEPPAPARPIMFVDSFPPAGKIHLVPVTLDRDAIGGLYVYKRDPATSEFPLALISPALATQISSTFGELRHAPGELELSPADAAVRGISTGDTVARVEPARRGPVYREGLGRGPRRRVRAREGAVAQAHRERLHVERADPRRVCRSRRPGRVQRRAHPGRARRLTRGPDVRFAKPPSDEQEQHDPDRDHQHGDPGDDGHARARRRHGSRELRAR